MEREYGEGMSSIKIAEIKVDKNDKEGIERFGNDTQGLIKFIEDKPHVIAISFETGEQGDLTMIQINNCRTALQALRLIKHADQHLIDEAKLILEGRY